MHAFEFLEETNFLIDYLHGFMLIKITGLTVKGAAHQRRAPAYKANSFDMCTNCANAVIYASPGQPRGEDHKLAHLRTAINFVYVRFGLYTNRYLF
jgi:hypothetical protein